MKLSSYEDDVAISSLTCSRFCARKPRPDILDTVWPKSGFSGFGAIDFAPDSPQ